MVSLVDIGPSRGSVPLRGEAADIRGLTAEHIVVMFQDFTDLRKLVTGKSDVEVMTNLFNNFPVIVGRIIAMGCGANWGDADFEAQVEGARHLTLGEQWAMLVAIMALTFPQGPKSFLDGVAGLIAQADAPGWGRATTLHAQSNGASPPAEASETAGTQPQNS
jgi:hypothetical protein